MVNIRQQAIESQGSEQLTRYSRIASPAHSAEISARNGVLAMADTTARSPKTHTDSAVWRWLHRTTRGRMVLSPRDSGSHMALDQRSRILRPAHQRPEYPAELPGVVL